MWRKRRERERQMMIKECVNSVRDREVERRRKGEGRVAGEKKNGRKSGRGKTRGIYASH